MNRSFFTALLGLFFLVGKSHGQPDVPKSYFRSPVDIPITLSGTFGEPRSTHFHSGLDIKTQGREGLPIYAIADGYVSRIKISPWGFGHALYIKHPNGYESVYAHLSRYNDEIADVARSVQYQQQSFEIEYYPDPGVYTVTKGDVIAYSGNSGSSGGPHLHFEIRDSLERPYNPLLFGYQVTDSRPPAVHNIGFYRMDGLRFLTDNKVMSVSSAGSHLSVSGGAVIKLNTEKLGLAVHSYDQLNGAANKNGIYAIELYDGDELIYHYRMDRFAFTETRYVHCHMDAKERDQNGRSMHRCFSLPGNELSTYPTVKEKGLVDLSDGRIHELRIEVKDFSGNSSSVKLRTQFDSESDFFNPDMLTYDYVLPHNQDNTINRGGIFIDIPEGTLFDTLHLAITSREATSNSVFSKVYTIGDPFVPAFDWFELALEFDPREFKMDPSKVFLVHQDHNGRIKGRGGYFEGGMIHGEIREFGLFFLMADTTAPVLKPINIYDGKNVSGQRRIDFQVTDNLSGLDKYLARIDGVWALLEYNPKRNKLSYPISPDLKQGEHKLVIDLYDERQNLSTYSTKFKL